LPNRIASVRLTPACAFEPGRFRLPELEPSPTVGVGSSFTRAFSGRLFRSYWLGPPVFAPSCTVGVGSRYARSRSAGPPVGPASRLAALVGPSAPVESFAPGVGSKDEDAFSLVRGSEIGSSQAERRPHVKAFGQLTDDGAESRFVCAGTHAGCEAGDVFDEHEPGSK
jgi:hypothetical protein